MSAGFQLKGRLIIETFDNEKRTGYWEADNTICVAGLSDMAAAIAYLGVEDIASSIDATPAVVTPIYGAIGVGDVTTVPPALTDTQLVSEVSRQTAATAASAPALGSNPGQVIWQFQFPINNSGADFTLTEAGVFMLATSATNSGDMLDHAVFTPAATWVAGQSLILSIQLSLFAVAW